MCGRYSVLTEDEIIEVRSIIRELSLRLARDELESYEADRQEIAPTNRAPVITGDGDALAFELGQFGFERWDGKGVIINARAETAHEKSMFRNRLNKGRCIIPANGYYEWKLPVEGQKQKVKHLIKDKHGNLLFMAGLYKDGKNGREFVVITKEAYGGVKDIHGRMPVMLRTDQLEAWLSGVMPVEALTSLDFECSGTPCGEDEKPDDGDNAQTRLF